MGAAQASLWREWLGFLYRRVRYHVSGGQDANGMASSAEEERILARRRSLAAGSRT
jgi:hypothetical protein